MHTILKHWELAIWADCCKWPWCQVIRNHKNGLHRHTLSKKLQKQQFVTKSINKVSACRKQNNPNYFRLIVWTVAKPGWLEVLLCINHSTIKNSRGTRPVSPYVAEQVLLVVYMGTTHPRTNALFHHLFQLHVHMLEMSRMVLLQRPWDSPPCAHEEPAFADKLPFWQSKSLLFKSAVKPLYWFRNYSVHQFLCKNSENRIPIRRAWNSNSPCSCCPKNKSIANSAITSLSCTELQVYVCSEFASTLGHEEPHEEAASKLSAQCSGCSSLKFWSMSKFLHLLHFC